MLPVSEPLLLRPDQFPAVLSAFRCDTGVLVWEARIERPEGLAQVNVPPLARRLGVRILVCVELGDGTVVGDHVRP